MTCVFEHAVARAAGGTRRPALHDVVDLTGINGLILDQGIRHGVQRGAVGHQNVLGLAVAAVNDGADFVVDIHGGLGGDVLALGDGAAQETSPSSSS